MAKLTSAARNKLQSSQFALPGRRYPIPDKSHAKNAKARVSQFGSPAEKSKVRGAVKRKFGFKKGGAVPAPAANPYRSMPMPMMKGMRGR